MSAPEMTEQLSAALAAQARGWYPFPVDHPSSPNCMGTACIRAIREEADKARQEGRRADYVRNVSCQPGQHDKRGKHPVGRWSTMTAAVQDEKMLALWFGDTSRPANIGIACKPSELVVLDEDKLAALQLLAAELGQEIPHTYRVRTARGWHYYFRAPRHVQLGNRSGRLKAHGIDVRGGRGDGGYVLGHGSVHATGVIYTAEDVHAELAELPDWLIAEIMDVGATNATPAVSAPTATAGVATAQPTASAGGVWGDSGGARARPGDADWNGWDNEVRFGTAEQLREQYERHCDQVLSLRGAGGDCGFRFAFYIAARDGWRLYRLGLVGESELYATLRELIAVVWDAEPDAGDKAIVKDALSGPTGADASPWQLLGAELTSVPNERSEEGNATSQAANHDVTIGHPGSSPQKKEVDLELNSVTDGSQADGGPELNGHASASAFGSANGESVAPLPTPEQADAIAEQARVNAYEAEVAAQIRWADVREEAQRRRRRRDRGERPSIKSQLINVRQLHTVRPPTMLVGQLIQDRGVGFLAGKYGSYKTFVAVSLACSIALGRPWMDDEQFAISERKRVLYVAAEGASGVAERIQAWERRYAEIGQEWLDVYDRPVKLADPDEVAELAELVREGDYGFIVIDTFHRSSTGMTESSNSEIGLIFAAMAGIRDECGATVMFIDHTGHGQQGQAPRIRDASSKGDDSDYVLITDMPGEDRSPANQRTLSPQKLKDYPTGQRYPLRLTPAPPINAWDERRPMLLEIGEIDEAQVFHFEGTWFDGEAVEVPDELAALTGKGCNAARDIFRILRHIDNDHGVTTAAIKTMLQEARKYADSTVYAALSMLERKGITVVGDTPTKTRLADRFEPDRHLTLVRSGDHLEDQEGEESE
jgi:hypothetical protein